jgi:antirestriction protein ArdC
MLWSEVVESGHTSTFWTILNRAQGIGAHVRKGESGHRVVCVNTFIKTEEGEKGQHEERKIPRMNGYSVSKMKQIVGANTMGLNPME